MAEALSRGPLIFLVVFALLGGIAATAGVQEPGQDGLVPRWGGSDNRLSISGSGFRPNERVTVTVRTDGWSAIFMVNANAEGSFLLETDLIVPSGSSVELTALGDQGTRRAAITSAPSAQQGQTISVMVTTDKPGYNLGEPVRFTLTAMNTSGSPVTVLWASGQRYDFLVRSADGAEVWRWSRDKVFILILQELTLSPGESLTFQEVWDQRDNNGQPVVTGTYVVVGVFTSTPPIQSSPRSFTIGQAGPPGVAAAWLDRPPGSPNAGDGCPAPGQWRLSYWSGEDTTSVAVALERCPRADRIWAHRSGRWFGYAKGRPEVSDLWNVLQGEAGFLHAP